MNCNELWIWNVHLGSENKQTMKTVRFSQYDFDTLPYIRVYMFIQYWPDSPFLLRSATAPPWNSPISMCCLLRLTGSQDHMFDRWVCDIYAHQHSFTQWLNYEQKRKSLWETERMRAGEMEEWGGGILGGKMLKCELQTRAAPSGPRKHTS